MKWNFKCAKPQFITQLRDAHNSIRRVASQEHYSKQKSFTSLVLGIETEGEECSWTKFFSQALHWNEDVRESGFLHWKVRIFLNIVSLSEIADIVYSVMSDRRSRVLYESTENCPLCAQLCRCESVKKYIQIYEADQFMFGSLVYWC